MNYTITLCDDKWNFILAALDQSMLPHVRVVDLAAEMQAQCKEQDADARPDFVEVPAKPKRGRKPKVAPIIEAIAAE